MAFKKIEKDIVDGIVNILKDYVIKIILYGSVARNEATEESDIDIAIIIKQEIDDATRNQLIEWCANADIEYDCILSIVDIEQDKFETWKGTLPFYKKVNEEGIVLWKVA